MDDAWAGYGERAAMDRVPEGAGRSAARGVKRPWAGAGWRSILVGGAILVAVATGLVLWLVLRGGGEKSTQRAPGTAASITRLLKPAMRSFVMLGA